MAFTLTTPQTGQTVTGFDLTHVHIDLRTAAIVYVYNVLDNATPPNVVAESSAFHTFPQFVAAFVAAAGGLRLRLYACFQAALGNPPGVAV